MFTLRNALWLLPVLLIRVPVIALGMACEAISEFILDNQHRLPHLKR